MFAFASTKPGTLSVYTSEDQPGDVDDEGPMTLDELRASLRRVLGADLPVGEATRLTRFTYHARQAARYRDGRVLLAGDAAHLFPASGVGLNAGLMDAVNWAGSWSPPCRARPRPGCWTATRWSAATPPTGRCGTPRPRWR